MKKWVADFETTTDPNNCRVWAWGVVELENPKNFFWGNDIKSFLKWCENESENGKVWFHNLKFDSQFIISELLSNGWKWTNHRSLAQKTFTTLITQNGAYYSLKILFKKSGNRHVKNVEFYDSMKLLNMSVEKISRAFKLNICKQEIDYEKPRPIGYKPTPLEIHYLNSDCMIVACALKKLFDNGVSGITIGQAAMSDFKKRKKKFSAYFPTLPKEVEDDVRQAYKGGFTYLNPLYADKEIGSGFFIDRNSMYPTILYESELPCGKPVFFSGEFHGDSLYKLFIQKISVVARLKEGKTPFLRSRTHPKYHPLYYIEDTDGEFLTVTLTNFEIDLLFENYYVDDIVYHKGWKFRSCNNLFGCFVDYWKEQKEVAKGLDDPALYQTSKLMLNSLIGKFGCRNNGKQNFPMLNDEGIVEYKSVAGREERKPVYSPIALFVTAIARCELVRTINKIREFGWKKYNKDVYVYSDTDSCATLLEIEDLAELEKFIELDDKKTGAWKVEKVFSNAKFIHAKCYMIIDYDGVPHATVAGMPTELAKRLKLEQFSTGFSTESLKEDSELMKLRSLKQVPVKGGVILKPVDFTI